MAEKIHEENLLVAQSVPHKGSQYLGIVTIISGFVGPEIKFCPCIQKELDYKGLPHINKVISSPHSM